MHLSLLMLFAAGWVLPVAQPRSVPKYCPGSHEFVETVYIAFEKEIVPKLEVLLKQTISKRLVAEDNYFPNITARCRNPRTDAKSLARSNILLGRINYISNLIADSARFQRASGFYPIKPLTIEMERIMRAGAAQASQVVANKLAGLQFATLTLSPVDSAELASFDDS